MALNSAKAAMSLSSTVHFITLPSELPAASRVNLRLSSACVAWVLRSTPNEPCGDGGVRRREGE